MSPLFCSAYDMATALSVSSSTPTDGSSDSNVPALRRLAESASTTHTPSPFGLLLEMGVLRTALVSHNGLFSSSSLRTLGEVMRAVARPSGLTPETRESLCGQLEELKIMTAVPYIASALACATPVA